MATVGILEVERFFHRMMCTGTRVFAVWGKQKVGARPVEVSYHSNAK